MDYTTILAIGGALMGVLGACLTIMNIVDKIIAYKKMINSPEVEQNNRLDSLEGRMDDVEDTLKTVVDQHENTKEALVLSMQALFDLININIDGGKVEELKATRSNLQAFISQNSVK